jgi:hypothetical protein
MRDAIIVLGMPRSGSTLVFNLARELLVFGTHGAAVPALFAEGDKLDGVLETALVDGRSVVLKAHKVGPLAKERLVTGRVAGVYSWRDPRDAIVSHMKFFDATFARALGDISRSLQSFEKEWKGHCLEIAYPELHPLSSAVILRLAKYLEIDCPLDLVQFLTEKYSLQQIQAFTREPENFAGWRSRLDHTGHKVTTVGEWHEGHVQLGEDGAWREVLSAEQVRTLDSSWLSRYFLPRSSSTPLADTL